METEPTPQDDDEAEPDAFAGYEAEDIKKDDPEPIESDRSENTPT